MIDMIKARTLQHKALLPLEEVAELIAEVTGAEIGKGKKTAAA